MADCHSASATARPTLVIKVHVGESVHDHILSTLVILFMSPGMTKGISWLLSRDTSLLSIQLLMFSAEVTFWWAFTWYIFISFVNFEISICTHYPQIPFLPVFPAPSKSPTVQPSHLLPPLSQYAIIFLLRKMHSHCEDWPHHCPSGLSQERAFGSLQSLFGWYLHNVWNHL